MRSNVKKKEERERKRSIIARRFAEFLGSWSPRFSACQMKICHCQSVAESKSGRGGVLISMRKLCYLFEHVKLCMRNMLTAFDGGREGRIVLGKAKRIGGGGRCEFGHGEGRETWGSRKDE